MAFIDARTLPPGHRIESDVCVVGSGAAGLAIAKHFLGTSRKVAILESGGERPDKETQDLYRGDSVGQLHSPLNECRLRYYGGTTNHWTAHVRTLDSIDFEQRAWVPHSGWPIGLDELAPRYEQAREFLRLPANPFNPAEWVDAKRQPWPFEDARIQDRVRRIIRENNRRLGPMMRKEIASSSNVSVYLHANVLRVVLNEDQKRVERLDISAGAGSGTNSGATRSAIARSYVLATGGIENPRVLLLSNIGSSADPEKNLVGRFFANHPATNIGEIQLSSKRPGAKYYQRRNNSTVPAWPFFTPSAKTQSQHRLLNTWLQIMKMPRASSDDPFSKQRRVALLARDMNHLGEGLLGHPGLPAERLMLRVIGEQAPNPQSRVYLGEERDRLGQRRAVLDWQLNELDNESARRTTDLVARELGIAGLGRIRPVFPKEGWRSVDARGSFHHMGTTRMHADPRQGVVDVNCRIHGVSNLYVAGSSVFPTTGTSNPTYTILALAFRLADHLDSRLQTRLDSSQRSYT